MSQNINNCIKCSTKIMNKEFLICSLCKVRHDLLCASVSRKQFTAMSRVHKNTWKCKMCCNNESKSDNSSIAASSGTILDTSILASDNSSNVIVTRRGKILKQLLDSEVQSMNPTDCELNLTSVCNSQPDVACCCDRIQQKTLSLEIQSLRRDFDTVNEILLEILASVKLSHVKLDEHTTKLTDLEERIVNLDLRMTDFSQLHKQAQTNNGVPVINNDLWSTSTGDNQKSLITENASKEELISPFLEHRSDLSNLPSNVAVTTPIQNMCSACAPTGRNKPLAQNLTPAKMDDTESRSKKSRRPISVRCVAGPDVTTLKAVDPKKFIHLWNMASETDEVLEYLQKLCCSENCTVEKLNSKGDYKSYKLGVPEENYKECLSADAWPFNARIKPWVPFRRTYTSKLQKAK